IGELISHGGATPELNALHIRYELQAGLKALETGNGNTAARYINDAFSVHPSSKSIDIFNEVNNLINRSSVSQSVKDRMLEISKIYYTDGEIIAPGIGEGYKSLAKTVPID